MNPLIKNAFFVTIAVLLAGALSSCAPPTDPAPVTTTASTAILSLTFKTDADGFVSGDSWAKDSIDKATGEQTINVYGGNHSYTPAATLDLSKVKSLSVGVKGEVANTNSWWFAGFRIVLIDNAGKKFDFADIKDTTDFNSSAFTTVKRTVAEGNWEDTGTGDLTKVASITIYTNYGSGTLVLKNLVLE